MKISQWITDRIDDMFVIVDEDGNIVYDARKTPYEPKPFIMDSVIVDIYTWKNVTVLSI